MNDTITIPTDRLQDGILHFVEKSALAHCTGAIRIAGEPVRVTSQWPVAGFSSGEQAAWGILRSLVSGDLRRLLERSDADTVAALIGGLASVHLELVSA